VGNVEEPRPRETPVAQFCKCLIESFLCPALRVAGHRPIVNNISLVVEVREEELIVGAAFTCTWISAIAELVGIPVRD
jgi:hypothetical protein